MRIAPLLSLLAALGLPGGALAVTLSFDEGPAHNDESAALGDDFAQMGVHLQSSDAVVWDGRSRGDPGAWGLEGRNGSSFLGFNGHSVDPSAYDLAASFDAPVSGLRLDVASSSGSEPGALFTLEGYRNGVLVERETLELGDVNDWQTAGIDTEIDELRWWGEDDRFHPFGVDNLRWIPADVEPDLVEFEVRPGTRTPLDPTAGGMMGAIVFGHEGFVVEDVDETTLAMGPDGAAISNGASLHFRDVDQDGWLDMVALYRLEETGIDVTDPEVCLTGETFAGQPFEGCVPLLVSTASAQ